MYFKESRKMFILSRDPYFNIYLRDIFKGTIVSFYCMEIFDFQTSLGTS